MRNDTFTPLLTTTDWNEEWMQLQKARQHFDDSRIWDEKAKTFPVKHGSQEGYVEQFLRFADLREGESVLDMGCGTGALATPLAQRGHHVVACDFSRGMLDVMLRDMRELGVNGVNVHMMSHEDDRGAYAIGENRVDVHVMDPEDDRDVRGVGVSRVDVHVMSWEDDWESHGIGENCVDVAFASRSIATHDLQASLLKLHRVARRRACITLPASLSPKSDPDLLAAAGFTNAMGRDFLYAFNILAALGQSPEVSYIPNTRLEVFESFEDALSGLSGIVRDAVKGLANDDELEEIPHRLESWLNDNLVEGEKGFHLKHPRNVTWAFIAWKTC